MAKLNQLRTLNFDIGFTSESQARQHQDKLEHLIKRRLLDTIDKIIDGFAPDSDEVISIDELHIDLGTIESWQIDYELEYRLRHLLQAELDSKFAELPEVIRDEEALSDSKRPSNWVEKFLTSGVLPWWHQRLATTNTLIRNELLEVASQKEGYFARVLRTHFHDEQVVKRLLNYFSKEEIIQFAGADLFLVRQVVEIVVGSISFHRSFISKSTYKELWIKIIREGIGTSFIAKTDVTSLVRTVVRYVSKQLKWKEEDVIFLSWMHTTFTSFISSKREVEAAPILQTIKAAYQKSNYAKRLWSVVPTKLYKATNYRVLIEQKPYTIESFRQVVKEASFQNRVLAGSALADIEVMMVSIFPNAKSHTEEALRIVKSFSATFMLSKADEQKLVSYFWVQYFDRLDAIIRSQEGSDIYTEIIRQTIAFIAQLASVSPFEILSQTRKDSQKVLLAHEKEILKSLEKELTETVAKNKSILERILQRALGGINLSDKESEALVNLFIYLIDGYGIDKTLEVPLAMEVVSRTAIMSQVGSPLSRYIKSRPDFQQVYMLERLMKLSITESLKDTIAASILEGNDKLLLVANRSITTVKQLPVTYLKSEKELLLLVKIALQLGRVPVLQKITIDRLIIDLLVVQGESFLRIMKAFSAVDLNEFRRYVGQFNLLEELESTASVSPSFIKRLEAFVSEDKEQTIGEESKEDPLQAESKEESIEEKEKSALEEAASQSEEELMSDDELMTFADQLDAESSEVLSEAIYIQNAGIVLLGPYIPMLFKRMELFNDKKEWKSQKAKLKGLELLHYLVFGVDEMVEYNTVLNKLLVGLPLNLAIPAKISLSLEEKELCDSLLKSVNQNWTVMKNSSVENLRGSFLIRDGKLTKLDAHFLLKVEEKGFDVLIDKLPWSFNLLKFSWIEKPIFVEWR